MSIYGKAAQFLGKVKGSNGFGFVPKAKQAAKKMYGFGRDNPGKTTAVGGIALLGGAAMSQGGETYNNPDIGYDDPWGDNITVPINKKTGEIIKGKEADKFDIYTKDKNDRYRYFEQLLYKGHTFQKINPDEWSPKDIQRAKEWYIGAAQKAQEYMQKYSDNPDVMRAQQEKLEEVQFVMNQIGDK